MTKREGYSKRMEQKLAVWKTRFEAERAEAEKLGTSLKADIREKIEAAKVAGDAAFAKLRELRTVAAHWGELRDQMEIAWRAIARKEDEAGPADAAPAPPPARRASGA